MTHWSSHQVRDSFINFFKGKEHLFIRSAPVVPLEDPTLLFTNAGMNQFKAIFLGENKDNLRRAANSQKCIRVSGKHNDLDVVGKDNYHHTLFEMLGNWSFGDYYKQEAISWAWELLTEIWKLPKERLFVTVYKDDNEAAEIWAKVAGLPQERIMRFGEKQNFWEMGDIGPCGPCSEIHYDTGDLSTQANTSQDPILGVNGENDRYIEIWNLVFMQYQRLSDGSLKTLPQKHVDTGMGFERVCRILQGVGSNYDTDLFSPILAEIGKLSGQAYQPDQAGIPHRVIADHLRALTFAITDGALPGNEGRGYVLRRILRRASRYARNIGQKDPFIYKLVPVLSRIMGEAFPELLQRADFVMQVIKAEEERFNKTLDQGLERFEKMVLQSHQKNLKVLSGLDAFTLYDTYGFPLDLTTLLAEEKGMSVDTESYEKEMTQQQERAKKAAKFGNQLANDEGWVYLTETAKAPEFCGYTSEKCSTKALRYKEDGGFLIVFLENTPFYAESGGQVGDTGRIYNDTIELEVVDTFSLLDAHAHKTKLISGSIGGLAQVVYAEINSDFRLATRRHHSATHLLQASLQKVLGDHVQQQGSRVSPESLRFDFTHFAALSPLELDQVENLVNEEILASHAVHTQIESYEEAKKSGAMALFGEKYGDEVRVISMGSFSKELCGGTHVSSTGQIGMFKILSESSTAAGVRRIEAVAGKKALYWSKNQNQTLNQVGQLLKAKSGEELIRLTETLERKQNLEKELEKLHAQQMGQLADKLVGQTQQCGFISQLICDLPHLDKKLTTLLVDEIGKRLHSTVAVLIQQNPDQAAIFALVSSDLTSKIQAGKLVQELAALAGGKGGGKPDRAQAGFKNLALIPEIKSQATKKIQEVFL